MNAEDICTEAIIMPTGIRLQMLVAHWPRDTIERRLLQMVDLHYYRCEDDTYDIDHSLWSIAMDEHVEHGGILRTIISDLTELYAVISNDMLHVSEAIQDFMEWSEVADGHCTYTPQRWVLWVDPYDY